MDDIKGRKFKHRKDGLQNTRRNNNARFASGITPWKGGTNIPQEKISGGNTDYLALPNPKQRNAAQYGVKYGNAKNAGPLLIIAGAGNRER